MVTFSLVGLKIYVTARPSCAEAASPVRDQLPTRSQTPPVANPGAGGSTAGPCGMSTGLRASPRSRVGPGGAVHERETLAGRWRTGERHARRRRDRDAGHTRVTAALGLAPRSQRMSPAAPRRRRRPATGTARRATGRDRSPGHGPSVPRAPPAAPPDARPTSGIRSADAGIRSADVKTPVW